MLASALKDLLELPTVSCRPPGPTLKNFLVDAATSILKVPSLNRIPQQKAAAFPAHPLPFGEMSVYMRLLYLYNDIGL